MRRMSLQFTSARPRRSDSWLRAPRLVSTLLSAVLHRKHESGLGAADTDLLDAHLTIGIVNVPHHGFGELGIAFLHLHRAFGLHLAVADHRLLVVDLNLILARLEFGGAH